MNNHHLSQGEGLREEHDLQGQVSALCPVSSGASSFPIKLTNSSRRYGNKWALRDISLTIEPGIFGLLGRNGAGKTTLLSILATLLKPTSGTVTIGPYDSHRQRWQIRSLLGFLPQKQGFYPQLTVRETLRYMAELQGLTRISASVDEALEAVHLVDRARTRVRSLSGGMRRRLGLAVALLGQPKALIIDEPTTGLDPVEQQRFRMLLGTLGAQRGRLSSFQHTLSVMSQLVPTS